MTDLTRERAQMTTRRIYQNDTDHFSAESKDEADRMYLELYDIERSELDPFKDEPLPDDKMLKVMWDDDVPEWVRAESLAWVENEKSSIPTICAPAHVWARNESGMVGSTEY